MCYLELLLSSWQPKQGFKDLTLVLAIICIDTAPFTKGGHCKYYCVLISCPSFVSLCEDLGYYSIVKYQSVIVLLVAGGASCSVNSQLT